MLVLRNPGAESSELEYVRRALLGGQLVVVPTDTVYGLAAHAMDEGAVAKLYALKGRSVDQPTAVVFSSVAEARDGIPGLTARASWAIASLCPGPWTLIVDNPDGVLPWLTGGAPGPIAVRVPAGALALPPVAASSANPAGAPTARTVAELDPSLTEQIACAVDRGPLGSTDDASTILDLSAWERGDGEISVLRDDAGRAGVALAVLADAP